MQWNNHYRLEGTHAFLGASKPYWLNYDPDKLVQSYNSYMAAEIGTRKHALAKELIELKVKLPRTKQTLNMYVNDGIGYDMKPEQVLFYSENAYGTTDTISFDEKAAFLRIHDLKTGTTPAHIEQLQIYAALFCLEYHIRPGEIKMELRIYQNDDIQYDKPGADIILPIMDKIVQYDKILQNIKK
ncbi:hypothetical protein [Segatella bryantii]|uniref:hypothetical protein n=1 Tax=Segatella bryantii TaxID=77095 RepID=UPI00242C99D4|nr:hypothetical protein [Segatella bryantii]